MSRSMPLPLYPNGWFRICDSDELVVGELKKLHYFGEELVAFRDAEQSAVVLDAFCVHLGAHLGYGGTVEEGIVRCPFHGWRYDGSGQCVDVPYAKKIPKRANIRSWPVCERNGMVMVWCHHEGLPPQWEIPEIPEFHSEEWTDATSRRFLINAHTQEMAENICDPVHFKYVHGNPTIPPTSTRSDEHIFHVHQGLSFDTPEGEVEGSVNVQSHGLGFGRTHFSGFLDTLVIVTGTAVEGLQQEVILRFMVKKIGDAESDKALQDVFIAEVESQFESDIPIWENKTYWENPLLCDGDGPINSLRKWSQQFYP